MIDTTAVQIALRQRAISLVVATTGSTSLGSTTNSYTRNTGSFLADGLYPGMEVQPAGFVATGRQVLLSVTAQVATITGTITAQSEATGRSLTAGLPQIRAFENLEVGAHNARPWIDEQFVPATNRTLSFPADTGTLEETGLYILTWYGLLKYDVPAIRKSVDALKALFAPGTIIVAGSDIVRVRSDIGPSAGQLIRADDYMRCQLVIPWQATSTNVIAA